MILLAVLIIAILAVLFMSGLLFGILPTAWFVIGLLFVAALIVLLAIVSSKVGAK